MEAHGGVLMVSGDYFGDDPRCTVGVFATIRRGRHVPKYTCASADERTASHAGRTNGKGKCESRYSQNM